MKKTVLRAVCFTFAATVCLSGCSSAHRGEEPAGELWNPPEILARQPERPFDIEVDEETFQLSLRVDDETIPILDGSVSRAAEDYMEEGNTVSWRYPDEQIRVKLATEQDYLSVEITSERTGDHTFTWPYISAEQYYLPLGEGKRIPAGDPDWIRYLEQQQAAVMEQFSMPFWISSDGEHCVMFIMENPYRTQLSFFAKPALGFSVSHEYPEIGGGRTNRFRIYLTEKDPVSCAKIYRDFMIESGRFVTLDGKAEQNPDIEKLYGAPFIYLWGDFILSEEDINWEAFCRFPGHALAVSLPEVFCDADRWSDSFTSDLICDMKESGIDHAWIGLNSWEQAYRKPELVRQAADAGYLIASYGSYHSIHEPGKEKWTTARFDDLNLYEDATVVNKDAKGRAAFKMSEEN